MEFLFLYCGGQPRIRQQILHCICVFHRTSMFSMIRTFPRTVKSDKYEILFFKKLTEFKIDRASYKLLIIKDKGQLKCPVS